MGKQLIEAAKDAVNAMTEIGRLLRAAGFAMTGTVSTPFVVALQNLKAAIESESNAASVPVQAGQLPAEPTEDMLNAARDWAVKKYGIGIGNDAAIGCWKAMFAAVPSASGKAAVCTLPPSGWYCTRTPGHEGPCATRNSAEPIDIPAAIPEKDHYVYLRGYYDGERDANAQQDKKRCDLCKYDHGHAIGCANNPVDKALHKGTVTYRPIDEPPKNWGD